LGGYHKKVSDYVYWVYSSGVDINPIVRFSSFCVSSDIAREESIGMSYGSYGRWAGGTALVLFVGENVIPMNTSSISIDNI